MGSISDAVEVLPITADADLRLRALAALGREMGAVEVAADADALAERAADGRFYVACVGQFKRGKSTLLNGLIGRAVLPAGVVPVTAVVTIVRHGPRLAARIRIGEAWRDIAPNELVEYVSEAENPDNAKGVAAAEVFVPSPLLATGMCLVDTPGIGSVFAANTEATRAFVRHIDAGLIVLGGDPPISGDELALVADVAAQVHDLVVVFNKADRFDAQERGEARRFTERVLAERLGRSIGTIHDVSAADALRGDHSYDFEPLVTRLSRLARDAGADLARAAGERGAALLAGRLRAELDEERAALTRPLAETAARVAALTAALVDAERSLADLAPLFEAEQARISRSLDDARARYLADAVPRAAAELRTKLSPSARRGAALRREGVALAQTTARAALERWREVEQPEAETLYRQAATRFVAIANDFLQRLASGSGLDGMPAELPPEAGFRARSELYYTPMLDLAGRGPVTVILDAIVPRARRRRAIERDAVEYLTKLLVTNTSRIVGDLRERVLVSRRSLETALRAALRAAVAAAERARARAIAARAAGDQDTAAAFARVDRWRAALAELIPPIEGPSP